MKTQITILLSALLLTSTAHAWKPTRTLRDEKSGFTLKTMENMTPEVKALATEMATNKNKLIDYKSSQLVSPLANSDKSQVVVNILRVEEGGNGEFAQFHTEKSDPAKSIYASQAADKFDGLKAFELNKKFENEDTAQTLYSADVYGIRMAKTAKFELEANAKLDGRSTKLRGEVDIVPDPDGRFDIQKPRTLEVSLNHAVDGSFVDQRKMTGTLALPIYRKGDTPDDLAAHILSFKLNRKGDRLKVRLSNGDEVEYELEQDFANRKVIIKERNRKYVGFDDLIVRHTPLEGRTSVGAKDAFDGLKKKAVGAQ